MSEQNIGMILESVEDVYRNNRRHGKWTKHLK